MFRKYPEAKPIPCPFKSAPFTFSYNRGTGDCSSPVSKAESCTDDSRLVLKYQACPDVSATESNGTNHLQIWLNSNLLFFYFTSRRINLSGDVERRFDQISSRQDSSRKSPSSHLRRRSISMLHLPKRHGG